jgi:hypothetical protein
MRSEARGERLRARRRRATLLSAASLALLLSLTLLIGAPGSVSGAANEACPDGFQTITVAQAVSEGYRGVPPIVDAAGNGDGIVCRRPLGDGIFHQFPLATVSTIYHWIDNVTPRSL